MLEPKLTFESATPLDAETAALLQTHKAELLRDAIMPGSVPRLPSELEALLRAASLDEPLPTDVRGVFDLNRYTLAWGCSYLIGDRNEALGRLWRVYEAWQPRTDETPQS